ncbi:MAG: HEAT repeat domain-containing protein [Fuerstiella sp.]
MLFRLSACVTSNMTATAVLLLFGTGPATAQDVVKDPNDVTVLVQKLHSKSLSDQLEAAAQLGELGPYAEGAVSDLGSVLKSENPALQYEVLMALSQIGPLATGAVSDVSSLLSSDIPELTVAALETLRQIGSVSEQTAGLIEKLVGEDNDAVMTAAVRCLITTNGEADATVVAAVPQLTNALSTSRPSVRNAAAAALVEIGEPAIPALQRLLGSDVPVARLKACEVAGRLELVAAPLVPLLVATLQDEDERVIRAAVTALGQIQSDPDLVVPRLQQLLDSESAAVRADVLGALMQFGALAQPAVPAVLDLLKDQHSIVRAAGARALGRIGSDDAQVVQALVDAVDDPHGGVTIQAVNALSQLGPVAVPALVRMTGQPRFRDLAISVLGEMGPEAGPAVPALVAFLDSDDERLLREVFIALASIGPAAKSAQPTLLKLVRDPDAGFLRAGAAYVLGNIGETSCLPVLKQILSDPQAADPRTLRAAAWAVVMLQPDNQENAAIALPHLIEALSSELPLARQESLAAIARLGARAQPASSALIQIAQHDPEPAVRSEALHTMAELPTIPDDALPVAIAALENGDPVVRNAARFLLGKIGTRADAAAARLRSDMRAGAELDRIVAAWALVRVAPSAEHQRLSVPFMLRGLSLSNPEVRAEAARTLGIIGNNSSEVIAALKLAASDQDENAAAAAREALKKLHY